MHNQYAVVSVISVYYAVCIKNYDVMHELYAKYLFGWQRLGSFFTSYTRPCEPCDLHPVFADMM